MSDVNININTENEATHTPQHAIILDYNRGLAKFIFLSIITFGIYSIFFFAGIGRDLNTIAERYDGKRTMSYWLLFFIVGPLTLGIGTLVWFHKLSARIGHELDRRYLDYDHSAVTFWLWNTLGLCIVIGPLVYIHKLCKSINYLASDFNRKG